MADLGTDHSIGDMDGSELRSHSPTYQMLGTIPKMENALDRISSMSKKENLKVQKRVYRKEKKKAAKEILTTLRDPSVVLMADYLKVRGMLKSWTKFWCVLKPGVLILYKSQKQKSGHWVGTITLSSVKLIERPSKKDGFCFKVYHPLDQSIWAQKGPKNETLGAITQPLMYSSAIFRAPSETAGKTWMDALELALRCSSLLLRSTKDVATHDASDADSLPRETSSASFHPNDTDLNESDKENHFKDLKDIARVEEVGSETDSTTESDTDEERPTDEEEGPPVETPYAENGPEELRLDGGALTEEFADEAKSIIWCLMKQVRPGMDLSKVVLPTFILEPRSLLEKFADYYYHCDILSRAAQCDDALTRMKEVVRWYVSGFYKTPKGVKKPYNPILGETFRCYWKNPSTGSKTYYIAEQVTNMAIDRISHHPPVSAFYVSNRKDGFIINCAVLAKSKFYGNSVAANMDGTGKLTFLKLGEDYSITIPYGYAKGIIVGSLTMELGGKINIECDRTGYKAELEFKLRPFMGGSDTANKIVGKIKLGHETLFSINGRWDDEIFIKDKATGKEETLWKVDTHAIGRRLKRYTVPMECQQEFESERLWQHVSEALKNADQTKATEEKYILEEAQRKGAKERKITNTVYVPKHFEQDKLGDWIYKYADLRPWDPVNDIMQYEKDYRVLTQTRHKTPLVRQMSIVNVDGTDRRAGPAQQWNRMKRTNKMSESSTPSRTSDLEETATSDQVATTQVVKQSMSKQLEPSDCSGDTSDYIQRKINESAQLQRESAEKLRNIQTLVVQMAANQNRGVFLEPRDWLFLVLVLLLQTVLQWTFRY